MGTGLFLVEPLLQDVVVVRVAQGFFKAFFAGRVDPFTDQHRLSLTDIDGPGEGADDAALL